MIVIHSRFRYQGRPKFGGVLQPGDEGKRRKAAEGRARLPRSLLNNQHFLKPGRPHLDVWGRPAKKTMRLLDATEHGRPTRRKSAPLGGSEAAPQVEPSWQNSRILTCIPCGHER